MENSNPTPRVDEQSEKENTPSSGRSYGYPIHKAVVRGDLATLELHLKEKKFDINERDWHGNPPLHLAVHFRFHEIVDLLMQYGADPLYKNGGGFNLIEESIIAQDRKLVELTYKATSLAMQKEYKKRLPELFKALSALPDFYVEVKWEFKSWIPLVTRLAPHDTYRIWKRGASFRVDTTLVGFEKMTWKRGKLSFLFLGSDSEHAGDLIVMDHDKKMVEYTMESLQKMPEEDLLKDVNMLLKKTTFTHSEFRTDNVAFTPAKGWFGGEKREKVAGYDAQQYNFNNIELNVVSRAREAKPTTLEDPSLPKNYWDGPTKEPRGKGYGVLFPSEKLGQKSKSFHGSVWLSKDFPHTVNELLPILELLSPTNRHFAKLKSFIELKMPDAGFPVKIDLPLVPAVSALVTFLVFEERTIPAEKFVIPPEYNKDKLQLNFEEMEDDESIQKELEESKHLLQQESD